MEKKRYLGDGVYVAFTGYRFVLTTENGIRATNEIVLEPEVVEELIRYVDGFRTKPTEDAPPKETG
jgi:hypothetical protein